MISAAAYGPSPIDGIDSYAHVCFLKGKFVDNVCVIKARTRNPHVAHTDQQMVAIKCYRKTLSATLKRHLQREVLALKKVNSHRVTALYEVFLSYTHVCLVMEYMGGNNLHQYITAHSRGLEEDEARRFFRDIVVGIKDLHSADVVNRDIKAANVVLDESKRVAKICDNGFARLKSTACVSRLGTPYYQAPEIWTLSSDDALNPRYDGKRVDVWSLGVLVYFMLFGRYPFDVKRNEVRSDAEREAAIGLLIQQGEFSFPHDKPTSPECQHILKAMLTVQPEERITIDEILEHRWFLIDYDTFLISTTSVPELCHQSSVNLTSIINYVTIEECTDIIDLQDQ